MLVEHAADLDGKDCRTLSFPKTIVGSPATLSCALKRVDSRSRSSQYHPVAFHVSVQFDHTRVVHLYQSVMALSRFTFHNDANISHTMANLTHLLALVGGVARCTAASHCSPRGQSARAPVDRESFRERRGLHSC